jgi:hypothetical protein
MDHCSVDACYQEARYRCCCGAGLCEVHSELHIIDQFEGKHEIEKIKLVLKKQKKNMISQCKKGLIQLKRAKTEIMSISKREIDRILRITAKSCDELREVELAINSILLLIETNNRVLNKEDFNSLEEKIFRYSENYSEIFDDICLFKTKVKSDIDFESVLIELETIKNKMTEFSKCIETEFGLFDISDVFNNSYSSKKTCFFDHSGSKSLTIVDITTQKDRKVLITDLNTALTYPGFCELPDGKYFCCGGDSAFSTGAYSSATYIIDTDALTVQKLEPFTGSKGYIGEVCYFNNAIYVFSGYRNGVVINDCQKFDLYSYNWRNIAPLPEGTEYSSVVEYKNGILLCGWLAKGVFFYDVNTNSYLTVDGPLPRCHKNIFKGNKRIYVIDNGRIFESSDENGSAYKIIGKSTLPDQRNMSYKIRNRDKFYFVMQDYSIYCFSLATKSTSLLRKVQTT